MSSPSWEANYNKLKEYAKEHGHCNVPYKSDLRYFAKWVGRQKKRTNLTEEQRKKLTDIGFDWRSQREKEDTAWNSIYQRLVDYKAANGHCDVPQNYVGDRELATWVANQRRRSKVNKVREDRKIMLDSLGFIWEKMIIKKKRNDIPQAYENKWKEMFQKLVQFKEKHGTCNVPYNAYEEGSLGMWVCTQRRVYNQKTYMYGIAKEMNQERVKQLESIGFNFQCEQKKCSGGKDIKTGAKNKRQKKRHDGTESVETDFKNKRQKKSSSGEKDIESASKCQTGSKDRKHVNKNDNDNQDNLRKRSQIDTWATDDDDYQQNPENCNVASRQCDKSEKLEVKIKREEQSDEEDIYPITTAMKPYCDSSEDGEGVVV